MALNTKQAEDHGGDPVIDGANAMLYLEKQTTFTSVQQPSLQGHETNQASTSGSTSNPALGGQKNANVQGVQNQANPHYDAVKNPQEEEAAVEALLGVTARPESPTPAPDPNNHWRYGGPVPPFSDATKIPFLTETNKLQTAFIHCLPKDVPDELKDLESPKWKDGKFLIKTFLVLNPKSGRRTKYKIQIPLCLLLNAKTLEDRLTIVNFWLSQPKDEQLKMIRNREEGLLKYYMQLKDTRENTFRQAFISGNPLQQLRKKREKQLRELKPPHPIRDVEERRTVVVDEHSSCLDYILRPALLCVPCDQFRRRFIPPHHRGDFDSWGLYKDRRKEIVQSPQINPKGEYTCQQLFDVTKEVGRGAGHRKKRVLDFLEAKRDVQKMPSLIEWERKRTSKPCLGLSGEGFRHLILQASEQANRLAILRDETIPDSFGLPQCYKNRTGFESCIISKEERFRKPNRVRQHKCDPSAIANPILVSTDHPQVLEATAIAAQECQKPAAVSVPESDNVGLSRYHYVIRSKACAKDVDTEKGHKLCKACTDAAVMIRSVARDAAKPLNLSKGAALTKLDIAKLVTSPDLVESTIRNLRQQRAKEIKLARKELSNLRDRVGIPKNPRRKAKDMSAAARGAVAKGPSANVGVAEQLLHVEQQLQITPHFLNQQEQMDVAGYRQYELGDHGIPAHHHEVYYDSDDPAEPHEYGRTMAGRIAGGVAGHTQILPRGATTNAAPAKRQKVDYSIVGGQKDDIQ